MLVILLLLTYAGLAQTSRNYAELLGWKKDDKVVMFHVDDAGMSVESNVGVAKALEAGVATSASVMMPCPWTSDFISYCRKRNLDIGLHLTHTSEWKGYKWAPVSGAWITPGLTDTSGSLWDNVKDVLDHAAPQEIAAEMAAQVGKARAMGINPTHLDTHMGVLWSSPPYLEAYLRIAIREQIPVLLPGGHLTWTEKSLHNSPLSGLRTLVNANEPDSVLLTKLRAIGNRLWNAGLPVVDDLHLLSYDWALSNGTSDEELGQFRTGQFKELLQSLRPGITVILIHCTDAGAHFNYISDSGRTRRADLLAMTSENLKAFLAEKGFITTTWKELQRRRDMMKR
nr:polysaccharide deacetylase family protein [uncultured Dyadobacter sp.]